MYISTSNYFNDIKVIKTFHPISVSLIVGANIFSDISSSFTDFFGGRSGTYEKKINKLFEDAKTNLIAKAKTSGANGIIGFSVEYNEISGKDKGMLMVSIYGTPIKMEQLIDSSSSFDNVDYETFEKKLKATRIVRKYDIVENMMISKRDLDFVISSQVVDLEDFVFNLISLNKIASDDGGSIDAILFKYYNGFEPVVAKAMLYKALRNAVSAKNHLLAMSYLDKIWDLRLIDFKILIDNLNVSTLDERVYYLLLVMGEKENYSKDDIPLLLNIRDYYNNIKGEFGYEVINKKSIFGAEQLWVCKSCGSPNELTANICSKCKIRKVLLPSQKYTYDNYLEELDLRIDVLKGIFST